MNPMSNNPGNTGHRGYKMSKVTAIDAVDGKIAIAIACGHTILSYPHDDRTAEEWAQHIQQGVSPFETGTTRIRCVRSHKEVRA